MVNTFTSYQSITRDMARSIQNVQAQPMVQRETEYYLENIGKVKSVDDFMADDRLYRYAMKAHGLEDMSYAKAFIRKALEGGVEDSDSFANSLTDLRYREFVKTFNFASFGETAVLFDRTQQGTVDNYLRQTLEQDAGSGNEGVRLALYFERKAEGIESYYDILADPALSQVVRTALGFPAALAQADIDKQVELMKGRLDIEDLKDPEFLDKFIKQFTSLWEIDNPSSPAQTSIAALFGQPVEFGISTDVLLTLSRLNR